MIHARRLAVRAGRTTPLSNIDLDMERGVVGLLGRNGAGKTSLLRTLGTVIPPRAGEMTLFGEDLRDRRGLLRIRRRIGYAPQALTVLPHLTTVQQVEYAGWLKGLAPGVARRAATDALAEVGLADDAHTRSSRLSGGMLRRVGIAMALVADPDLILLDEPTAGLDPEQRARFRRLVTEQGARNLVILSTHLIEDVVEVCDRIVVVDRGGVVFDGDRSAFVVGRGDQNADRSSYEQAFLALTGGPP